MTFRGNRLKQLREDNRFTHTDLADKLGVSFAQIYRFEAGKASPDADVLGRMSAVFGVSADYLLGIVDEPTLNLRLDDLTEDERAVLGAMRRGDDREAIKIIVSRAS